MSETNRGGKKVCFQRETNFRLTSFFRTRNVFFRNLPGVEREREGVGGGRLGGAETN